MKRHGNLFDKIVSIDNLYLAHKNARKGKTKYREVIEVDNDLDNKIQELHKILTSGEYQVGKYTMFEKNDKGKIRQIYKLGYYPDRIIHHAILQILEPIWKPILISNTYQSIKGRGTSKCKDDVRKSIIKNIDKDIWILKIDIKKFYPSVNNDILKNIILRKIKCKRTLNLLFRIIDSHIGLPIGNYISQYLGNIYLSYLDQMIKESKLTLDYFRYCDDLVVMCRNKRDIILIRRDIEKYISKKLQLKIKENAQYFDLSNRPLDFVGFVFYKNGKTRLRKSIKSNFVQSLKDNKDWRNIVSYYGWVKGAKAYGLWQHYNRRSFVMNLQRVQGNSPIEFESLRGGTFINLLPEKIYTEEGEIYEYWQVFTFDADIHKVKKQALCLISQMYLDETDHKFYSDYELKDGETEECIEEIRLKRKESRDFIRKNKES